MWASGQGERVGGGPVSDRITADGVHVDEILPRPREWSQFRIQLLQFFIRSRFARNPTHLRIPADSLLHPDKNGREHVISETIQQQGSPDVGDIIHH